MLHTAFLEYAEREHRIYAVRGTERVCLERLRTQAVDLVRHMIERNRAAADTSVVCPYDELRRVVWGERRMANEKAQIARLFFEIRRVLAPFFDGPAPIRNVPGQGYMLRLHGAPVVRGRSPFICGPPVPHPAGFFGRELELKRIFGVWSRLPLQHIAIAGARRTGKTSLLHYLEAIHVTPPGELRPGQQNRSPADPRWQIVFADCQDPRLRTENGLLTHILARLGLPIPSPCSLSEFAEIMSGGIASPVIVLFDEIEAALASPEFSSNFWSGLRSLATNNSRGLLGYVIAMRSALVEPAEGAGRESPFLNIFGHTLTLGPLTREEARELVRSSPRAFSEADTQWILAESGCHPCLVQLLCDTRLTALEEGQPEAVWMQEGLRRIARFRHLLASP